MYDTANLVIQRPSKWVMPSTVKSVKEYIDKETGLVSIGGRFNSMFVKESASEILISGSLPCYYHGSNAIMMTRSDTEQSILKLSDALSLPLEDSRVYRLDIAANLMLNNPVGEYLATLGPWRQSNRMEFKKNGNLSYQGGRNTLTFYDKVLELNQKKHSTIPDHWINKNVLRIEFQMKKAVKEQLEKAVYGKDLWDEATYMKAIQKWKNAYLTVEKLKLMEDMPMGGVKELRAFIEYQGLQTVGYENILQRNRMARILGQITKSQAKENQRALKKMATYPKGEAKGLIEELDRKVETVVACYR